MDLGKLTEQFLVADEVSPKRLGELVQKLLPYCVVRKSGAVDIVAGNLSGKEQVRLVLAARFVASKLKESSVSAEICTEEIAQYTGLPRNQAAARAKECVDERFAERSARGSYRAVQHRLERFLTELSGTSESKGDR
jgi:hypothetical protein